MTSHDQSADGKHRLAELAWVCLKFGTIAFGGPAAHIAMMEDEFVRRHQWISREEFLDLLGATNLMPGPNSTEMIIHLGHRRAGWSGLVVAGACFILPAAIIVTFLAWIYTRFGQLPRAEGLLYGIKPVIMAIIVQALLGLGRKAMKSRWLVLMGLLATTACLLGANELMVLFSIGLMTAITRQVQLSQQSTQPPMPLFNFSPVTPLAMMGGAAAAGSTAFGLWPMFLFFLKVGSVLFGSGYVLLAFLRADLVDHWHWLSEAQLLDAVAVGQFTPGPLFTTATFIGFLLAGIPGAFLATVGIFLPAFIFVAVSGPLIPRIRRSPFAGAFLDGVNVASLALMAVVTWQLGWVALCDFSTVAIAALSGLLLFKFRINSAWLVLGGALIGMIIRSMTNV